MALPGTGLLNALWTGFEQISILPKAFSLENIEGFPYKAYEENRVRYEEQYRWYSGEALEETQAVLVDNKTKDVEIYPARVNPIKGACHIHASVLFGQVRDDGNPLVTPRFVTANDTERNTALPMEHTLAGVWMDSGGRSAMLENGLLSQIHGGCIFKIDWQPWDTTLPTRFRVTKTHPANFVGVPMPGNPWRLAEGWFLEEITREAALAYGITAKQLKDDEVFWLIEKWTPKNYKVTVNGHIPTFTVDGAEWHPGGVNPFGLVPGVYIPHMREAGFWGHGIVDDAVGLVREKNARLADIGDAVVEESHKYFYYMDVDGKPVVVNVAPGLRGVYFGKARNITGNENQAKVGDIPSSKTSSTMLELQNQLDQEIDKALFIPPVAYGIDEGSQRSGETLMVRFFPLTSHTKLERIFWSDGLNALHKMLMHMLKVKNRATVLQKHENMRMKNEWAPMLPKDEKALVDMVVARAGSNLGSLRHLMNLFDDVDDPEGMIKEIIEEKKMFQPFEKAAQEKSDEKKNKPQPKNKKIDPEAKK